MLQSQVGPRPRFPQMAHKVILDYTIVEEHNPCNRIRWWLLGKGSISMTMGTSYAHILNYLCVHLHYYKYVFSYFSYKHVMLMLWKLKWLIYVENQVENYYKYFGRSTTVLEVWLRILSMAQLCAMKRNMWIFYLRLWFIYIMYD